MRTIRLFTLLIVALCILPCLCAAVTPNWIWHSESQGAGANAPAGTRFFRQHFALPDACEVRSATCQVTADNAFTLYINGKEVGTNDDWQQLSTFSISQYLSKGDNLVAIEAVNWETGSDNPAGLIALLQISLAKGTAVQVVSDGNWRSSARAADGWQTTSFDDSSWRQAKVIEWGGWSGSIKMGVAPAPTSPIAKADPLIEPATETLSPEDSDLLLRKEWLFQAEGKPLRQRGLQEIAWAREMAGRLVAREDAPDLSAELAALKKLETDDGLSPHDFYLSIRGVKRQIMMKDPLVNFSRLAFIDAPQRYPHESMHRVYPQAQLNSVRLLVLDGLHPGDRIRKLTEELGPGWYWRPDVSYDGQRILFCFRPQRDKTFHLYEINADGSGLRQLTSGNYDDQDPVYLPDGNIAFVSNRGNSYARCVVGHPSTVVARCDKDGKNIYLISAGNEPEYTPAIMPNGQILYTRWEYTDKELMRIQSLWTVNPDGTGTSVLWGNQSYWPDMLVEARPIPGSHRVMFAGHGHHQMYWGSIGIVDPQQGFNYPHGLTKVTWDVPWAELGNGPAERPECAQYHTSGAYRGYKSPFPLSEELFLVSARAKDKDSKFKLFLMDVYGNRELIYEGAFHALYPIPIAPRPTPRIIADRVDWAGAAKDGKRIKPGFFSSANVLQGAPEVLKGKVKYLRVIQQDHNTMTLGKKIQDVEHPSARTHMHVGPVVSAVANDSVKFVLGYVPVEEDGSVNFEAPPCVPLHFQLLDEQQRALHTMRSFTNVMPGERRSCVGCHESQSVSPPRTPAIALTKPPAKITPYPMGAKYSLGYERDIQPILDKYCGECHQGQGTGKEKLDLTLRPSADGGVFPEPYLTLTLGKKRRMNSFPSHCEGGIADTILAQPQSWGPETYKTFPPMKALSYKSRLVDLASSGTHYKVQVDPISRLKLILWVDTLCAYRGEPELRAMADPDPQHPLFLRSNYPPSDPTVQDVYAESPYRPRMQTAPLVNRAYRQDEYPTVESRLPRNADGSILPTVSFTSDGKRVVRAPGK